MPPTDRNRKRWTTWSFVGVNEINILMDGRMEERKERSAMGWRFDLWILYSSV